MSDITQQIEVILDKRLGRGAYAGHGRLQKIESKIAVLQDIREKVAQLDALISTIQSQIARREGAYFNMFSSDPDVLAQFDEFKDLYSSADNGTKRLEALASLDDALARLITLKKRFEREAVRIAFIGRERQGKSTFIKTITGLNDKVVPAYSGNSCTGAVSVIHNAEQVCDRAGNPVNVKVVVEYYDTAEFLNIVNQKLRHFFPGGEYVVGRLDRIKDLQLPQSCGLANKIEEEYTKFKTAVVENYNDYAYLIGKPVAEYYDEDVIAYHVAQYEEFDAPTVVMYPVMLPNGMMGEEPRHTYEDKKNDGRIVHKVDYFKYVAVKSVDIYKRFEVETTKKLELVDTIGIGGSADTAAIKDEMFRVLREDCDAAIDLFRPADTDNWPAEQVDLLDEIEHELTDRDPEKWIVYVLNKVTSGQYVNEQSAMKILARIEPRIKRGIAWAKAIDGLDFGDVRDNLMGALLTLIADNLDVLDESLTRDAAAACKQAYNDCLTLVKAANNVTSASAGFNADALSLFDEVLFKDLLREFGRAMNGIDQKGYAAKRDTECYPLLQAYTRITDEIDVYIPDEEVILERFETGAQLTPTILFEEYVEQMRNDIFGAFEDVNATVLHPLQEKVKTDLIGILYEDGLMKNLPTEHDGPSKEWLESIIANYVSETTYPALYKALRFILDYQINIEGMVEYNVTESLYVIDKTHREFIRYQGEFSDDFGQMASNVWQELCNRLMPVQNRMRKWVGGFTRIPSHSFYSRVHKFHVKLMTDTEGREDFRRFYRKNMGLIWASEINAAGKNQKAFGEWTERVKELMQTVTSDNFKLS